MDIHKINNLLTTIQGFSEMLKDKIKDEDQIRWLTEIIVAVKGAAWLLNEKEDKLN